MERIDIVLNVSAFFLFIKTVINFAQLYIIIIIICVLFKKITVGKESTSSTQ